MSESKKAYCCHIGCENDADYLIEGPDGFEDYTHMCKDHVEEYTRDADKLFKMVE